LFTDPTRLRQYLTVVRGRAADLARIVAKLTTFTDLVAGDAPQSDRSVPTSISALAIGLAGERPIRLEVSAEAAGAPIDSERVHLVVKELLDNAFKFGTPGSEVLLRAELVGDPSPRLVVRVSNPGDDIPDDLREAIFAPFRQAESHNTRHYPGLGLGLSVARRAAEGAGGAQNRQSLRWWPRWSPNLAAGVPTSGQ
jgi:two-component system sensor histidine kinase KdpD